VECGSKVISQSLLLKKKTSSTHGRRSKTVSVLRVTKFLRSQQQQEAADDFTLKEADVTLDVILNMGKKIWKVIVDGKPRC